MSAAKSSPRLTELIGRETGAICLDVNISQT
jgi:hypothetical protein